MTSTAITARLPWEDRWSQPNLDQLLKPLLSHQRKLFVGLMEKIEQLDGSRNELVWYGEAWNWTVQYKLLDEDGDPAEDLCYLVPSLPAIQVCVPMTAEFIAELPMRRLTRYIRDGIGIAKAALVTHWATWTPNSQTEVNALIDLLKRRIRFAEMETA